MLALTFIASGLPAFASKVQAAEREVKEFIARFGLPYSSSQLANLSFVYLDNDMPKEAYAAFDRAIKADKLFQNQPSTLPDLYMNWAMRLVQFGVRKNSPTDLKNAKAAALRGLAIVNQTPNETYLNLNYQIRMIEFFKAGKMPAAQEAQSKLLDKQLHVLETNKNLPDLEAIMTAEILEKLSNLHITSEGFLGSGLTVKVIGDNLPAAPDTVKASDFGRAECYQLRAMRLYNRLPEDNYNRIEGQRRLVLWYRFMVQRQKADTQAKLLAKLL